jgi:hypothetical protein
MLSTERNLLMVSVFSLAVILTNCNENNDNPPDNEIVGWTAGQTHNGFATIFHTIDGGITWERQGDSTMILEQSTKIMSGLVGSQKVVIL